MDLLPASNENRTQRQQRIIDQAETDAHATLKNLDSDGQVDVDYSSPAALKSNDTNPDVQKNKSKPDKVTRRREINRINAKKSRLRKKLFVDSLVSTIERLEEENERLQRQLSSNPSDSSKDVSSQLPPLTALRTYSAPSSTKPTKVEGDSQPVHGSMLLTVNQGKKNEDFPQVGIQFASIDAKFMMRRARTNATDFPELFWNCDFRLIDSPVDKSGFKYMQSMLLKRDPTVCGAFIEADPSEQQEGSKVTPWGVGHHDSSGSLSADDRTQAYGCAASLSALQQVLRACARDHKLRMLVGWIRLPTDDPSSGSQAAFYQCYSCTLVLQYVREEGDDALLMCSCTWERYPLPVPSPNLEHNTGLSSATLQAPVAASTKSYGQQTGHSSEGQWAPQGVNAKPPELSLGPQRAPQELTFESLLENEYSSNGGNSLQVAGAQNPIKLDYLPSNGSPRQQGSTESDSSYSKTPVTEDPSRRGASVSGNPSGGNGSPMYSSQNRTGRKSEKASTGMDDSEVDSEDSMRSCGRGKSKNGDDSSGNEESVGAIMKAASGLCTLGNNTEDSLNPTVGAKRYSGEEANDSTGKRRKPLPQGRTFLLNKSIPSQIAAPKGNSALNGT